MMRGLSFVSSSEDSIANGTIIPDPWYSSAGILNRWSEQLDDIVAIFVLSVVFIAWSTRGTLWSKQEDGYNLYFISPQRQDGLDKLNNTPKKVVTRNIDERMTELGKDIIVFWGSQSGKSERLAKAFVRESQLRYGLSAMAADTDLFDFDQLATLKKGRIAGFIVATYGEGDPTDNATGLYEYLQEIKDKSSKPLSNLKYFCFGLGNSKYQSYNRFVDVVDEVMFTAGAQRIAAVGKADEALLADDAWVTWKEQILKDLGQIFGKEEREMASGASEASLDLVQRIGDVFSQNAVSHVAETQAVGGKSSQRAQIVQVTKTIQLTASSPDSLTRTYLHMELDTKHKGGVLEYQTGDHVAIWPMNPDHEADLVASLFQWDHSTRKMAVDVKLRNLADDVNATLPVPTPTTRDALLRYHLDICGPATSEMVQLLAAYAPTTEAKDQLDLHLRDPQLWQSVATQHLTCGQLMYRAAPNSKWPDALFNALLFTIPKLRPRYFSIGSSPLLDPNTIVLTAGVIETPLTQPARTFYGLTSAYLHAINAQYQRSAGGIEMDIEDESRPRYDLLGPRSMLAGGKLLAHVRTSPFKLPAQVERPLVLVAAGSGIAPFRAFVQERVALAQRGVRVGKMMLFFGCRSEKELLYHEIWQDAIAKKVLEAHFAFSRGTGKKTYVQDKLLEQDSRIKDVMLEQDGCMYICGSANMAQGVKNVLTQTLGDHTSVSRLKDQKRLQEDVWVS
jgi:NADPH-ferrihemoprotein reductase